MVGHSASFDWGMVKRLKKKNDSFSYEDIISNSGLSYDLMSGLVNSPFKGNAYLRHDLCGLASEAQILEMAHLENQLGVKSTYFVMPPGSYKSDTQNLFGSLQNHSVKPSQRGIGLAMELTSLGHEVGLHNNSISLFVEHGISPEALFDNFAESYREAGVSLIGTASHGSPVCREMKFNNREIFKGSIRKGWEVGRTVRSGARQIYLHSLAQKDYGFQFEAYSLPRVSTLSDSGGRWAGNLGGSKPFTDSQPLSAEEITTELRRSVSQGSIPISILIHPSHWDLH